MNTFEVVVTARPSWARVKSLLQSYVDLTSPDKVRVTICGSSLSRNFGNIEEDIPKKVKRNAFHTLLESDDLTSVALSASETINALTRFWGNSRPDAVLVIADRSETLAVASAAALNQIPLIHLQGGEYSGSIDNKVRDANSKLADLHLTTNEDTKKRLISLGEREELIRVVGCPSIDLIKQVEQSKLPLSNFEPVGVGSNVSSDEKYGIIMFHSDTYNHIDSDFWIDQLIGVVSQIPIKWYWFWPNSDFGTSKISKKLRIGREANSLRNVKFVINLTPEAFINLALGTEIFLGNSSFGIREASYLGLPVINLGKRQQNRQVAENVTSFQEKVSSRELLETTTTLLGKRFPKSLIYGDGSSGLKAAKAIMEWNPRVKQK